MNIYDEVMAVLRADPGREYSTSEITLAIWPEIENDRDARANRRNAVNHTLRVAERYGVATHTEHRRDSIRFFLWRAVA